MHVASLPPSVALGPCARRNDMSLLCMHVASLPPCADARRHDALTSPLSAHEPPRTLTDLFLHASRHGRRDGRCCWFVSCHTLVSPIHSHLFNVAIKAMHARHEPPACLPASMRRCAPPRMQPSCEPPRDAASVASSIDSQFTPSQPLTTAASIQHGN